MAANVTRSRMQAGAVPTRVSFSTERDNHGLHECSCVLAGADGMRSVASTLVVCFDRGWTSNCTPQQMLVFQCFRLSPHIASCRSSESVESIPSTALEQRVVIGTSPTPVSSV